MICHLRPELELSRRRRLRPVRKQRVASFFHWGRDRLRSRDTLLIQDRLEASPISQDTWQQLRRCNRPRLTSHRREKDCEPLEFPLRPESRTREQAWWRAEEWRLPRPRVRRLAGAMAQDVDEGCA